jgi:hypothetical protein
MFRKSIDTRRTDTKSNKHIIPNPRFWSPIFQCTKMLCCMDGMEGKGVCCGRSKILKPIVGYHQMELILWR